MIVSVDLTTTSPDVRLDEPDDGKRFRVAALVGSEGWLDASGKAIRAHVEWT